MLFMLGCTLSLVHFYSRHFGTRSELRIRRPTSKPLHVQIYISELLSWIRTIGQFFGNILRELYLS